MITGASIGAVSVLTLGIGVAVVVSVVSTFIIIITNQPIPAVTRFTEASETPVRVAAVCVDMAIVLV